MTAHADSRSSRARELRAAAIAALLIVVTTVAVFVKRDPFADHFHIRGVFATAATLHKGSEVRIGGQKVGTVTGIGAGPAHTALVTMEIDHRDPPVRTDATLSLQPRLALEGNGYVRVDPGTPGAAVLPRNGTIPAAQTSVAVQLDQAISTFDAPARTGFRDVTREFGGALGSRPASPRAPRPGYAELRGAVREFDRSLGTIATAAQAVRGQHPGDLRAAVRGSGDVTAQLAADPAALGGIVRNYATVSRALAAEDTALGATFDELARTLGDAPAHLQAIDAALPSLTRFAGVLAPALRAAPPALRALAATAHQVRLVARPSELPRLLTRLRPVTHALPKLESRLGYVLPQVTAIGRCLTKTVVPALNEQIDDGHLSTHRPVWQEALHMAASLAGAASGFDANGGTLRLGVTESEQAIGVNTGSGPLWRFSGLAPDGDVGLNPTWLGYGIYPATRPDAPCDQQKLPDFNARKRPGMPAAFRSLGRVQPKPATPQELRRLVKQIDNPETLLRQALKATK